jgi:hypothetical protein
MVLMIKYQRPLTGIKICHYLCKILVKITDQNNAPGPQEAIKVAILPDRQNELCY